MSSWAACGPLLCSKTPIKEKTPVALLTQNKEPNFGVRRKPMEQKDGGKRPNSSRRGRREKKRGRRNESRTRGERLEGKEERQKKRKENQQGTVRGKRGEPEETKVEPAEKDKRETGPHTQQGRQCCCPEVTDLQLRTCWTPRLLHDCLFL